MTSMAVAMKMIDDLRRERDALLADKAALTADRDELRRRVESMTSQLADLWAKVGGFPR